MKKKRVFSFQKGFLTSEKTCKWKKSATFQSPYFFSDLYKYFFLYKVKKRGSIQNKKVHIHSKKNSTHIGKNGHFSPYKWKKKSKTNPDKEGGRRKKKKVNRERQANTEYFYDIYKTSVQYIYINLNKYIFFIFYTKLIIYTL